MERPFLAMGLISHSSTLTIETDASTRGRGGVCNGVRTGSPWSPQEQQVHINCLELLAAHLAVKCFAKDKTNLTNLLKIDSMSALTYMKKLGGTISPKTELSSQRSMVVVHEEEYPLESPAPTGCTQHHSRQWAQGYEGLIGLEVEPNHLPTDQPEAGTSELDVCQ